MTTESGKQAVFGQDQLEVTAPSSHLTVMYLGHTYGTDPTTSCTCVPGLSLLSDHKLPKGRHQSNISIITAQEDVVSVSNFLLKYHKPVGKYLCHRHTADVFSQ